MEKRSREGPLFFWPGSGAGPCAAKIRRTVFSSSRDARRSPPIEGFTQAGIVAVMPPPSLRERVIFAVSSTRLSFWGSPAASAARARSRAVFIAASMNSRTPGHERRGGGAAAPGSPGSRA